MPVTMSPFSGSYRRTQARSACGVLSMCIKVADRDGRSGGDDRGDHEEDEVLLELHVDLELEARG